MNFQDQQNAVVQRLHQQGVNWGATAANTAQSLLPPYWVKLELNLSYARVLSKVKDFPSIISPILARWPTTANQASLPIKPLPSQGPAQGGGVSIANPAVLQVYEVTYTQSGGQMRYIPFVSTMKFRRYTAGYTQRQASFSAFPDVLCRMFGRSQIDMFPGTGVTGDEMQATVCPDPIATGRLLPFLSCAQGGPMVNDTDVPLIQDETYQQAIVEGAIAKMARDLNKPKIAAEAQKLYDDLVEEMMEVGSTALAEGDAEQQVTDTWFTTFDSQINILGGDF